jgi:hypothetical protein
VTEPNDMAGSRSVLSRSYLVSLPERTARSGTHSERLLERLADRRSTVRCPKTPQTRTPDEEDAPRG